MALDCFVYVIARKDGVRPVAPIKVGISDSPKRRLAQLRTGCPFPLIGVFSIPLNRRSASSLERTFHRYNAAFRLSGEWFDIDPVSAVHILANLLVMEFEHCGAGAEEIEATLVRIGVREDAERVIRSLREQGRSA